jgi:tetratricopeptide (TPR) repeat protein
MPTTTYMVVDPRHDHSFRIPRPDRSVSLGVPNACNQCHTDRKPQWAADALKAWFPQPKPGLQTFAEAFASTGAGAQAALLGVLQDRAQPAFVRASAIRRLGPAPGPAAWPPLRDALTDADALVRAAAAAALAAADPLLRAQWLAPLLADPVRQVRMEAARALVGAPSAGLAAPAQAQLASALDEVFAAERFNADRPEGRANLGNLHAAQGHLEQAVAAYQSALALDPSFLAAALNLADVHRSRGAESDAEKTLRAALKQDPRLAPAHLALGLSLARQHRSDDALKSFAQAAALAPDNARFAYVHAVALNDAGQRRAALRELERGLARQPADHDLLLTAALFQRDDGNRAAALGHARQLLALEPGNPDAQQLVRALAGSPR